MVNRKLNLYLCKPCTCLVYAQHTFDISDVNPSRLASFSSLCIGFSEWIKCAIPFSLVAGYSGIVKWSIASATEILERPFELIITPRLVNMLCLYLAHAAHWTTWVWITYLIKTHMQWESDILSLRVFSSSSIWFCLIITVVAGIIINGNGIFWANELHFLISICWAYALNMLWICLHWFHLAILIYLLLPHPDSSCAAVQNQRAIKLNTHWDAKGNKWTEHTLGICDRCR